MLKKKMTELMNRTSELTENRLVILHDPGVVMIIGGSTGTCATLSCGQYVEPPMIPSECNAYNYN
jgi:hypothetical protein